MTEEPDPAASLTTLLEAWEARSRLSWKQLALGLSFVMIVLAIVASALDGKLTGGFSLDYWRFLLMAPTIVAYVLLTQPYVKRLREDAIHAFSPLVPLTSVQFQNSLEGAAMFRRHREWIALCVGAAAGVLVTRTAWPFYEVWTTWYVIGASALMFGLQGWLVYSSLSGTRLFHQKELQPRTVSVFELSLLEPIGRWSHGVALSYVGGISLTFIFLPRRALTIETAIVLTMVSLAPVLVFFLNMLSTRNIIISAKKRELNAVRESLVAASQALQERVEQGERDEMEALLDRHASWLAVEKRIRDVPEWPYTARIRRDLALSLLLPLAVGVGQNVLAEIVLRVLG